jgi:hypothetical protein
MKYIFYAYCIGWSILILTVLGEIIACNLPDTNFFTKFWRSNIIGNDPDNTDF